MPPQLDECQRALREPEAEIARLAEALRKAEAEIARDNVIMAEAAQKMDELRAERKAAQEMVATK